MAGFLSKTWPSSSPGELQMFEPGERVKDSRRALNAHVVMEVSLSGNPLTYCGRRMFHATMASKKMNLCRKCKEASWNLESQSCMKSTMEHP